MHPLHLRFRRTRRLVLSCLPILAGCGSWQRVGSNPTPSPEDQLVQLLNVNTSYGRLGHLISTDQVHFVGSVGFVPGPGDSTRALVGLSLANREFAFQREGQGFGARYRVDYQFDRPGAPPRVIGHDQPIRVATFQETIRSDESLLLQEQVTLAPGDYTLTVRVHDLTNAHVGTATQKVNVPAFRPGSFTAPILAYEVRARGTRADSLAMVMNPRGTVAYGGDTLLVYFEGVGYTSPTTVPLQVRDERDSLILSTTVRFAGTKEVESQYIRLAPDSVPLGQLEVILGDTTTGTRRTSALVSFSAAWVVTNFDDLLSLLRYFGADNKLAKIRNAKTTDRAELWREFYHDTDPVPGTPNNEALDLYFARVAIANQRYNNEGGAGWRTDRGEVYIVLGDPDEILDASPTLQYSGRYYQWNYVDYRVTLYFQDQSGFGRFRLTPASRSDFERVKARVQTQR
jgi:GWxTD domain-containing protein